MSQSPPKYIKAEWNENAFAMLVYEIQGDLMQASEAFMICLAERNTMKIYFLSLFVTALEFHKCL